MTKDGGWQLPQNIDPPTRCITVRVPNDPNHIAAFWGALYNLTYWNNWQPDAAKLGTLVAQVWKRVWLENVQAWETDKDMTCCPEPTNTRILPDGTYQVSYDGGLTWEDAPQLDPRLTSVEFPPLNLPDGEVTQCAAAANIVSNLQGQLDEAIAQMNLGIGLTGLIAAILALAAVFMSGGTLAPLFTGVAAAIFGAGSAAISAAFTPEVWDTFRCILYCNVGADGEFSSANITAIKQRIGEEFLGVANTILTNWVNGYGQIGLTNMGRAGGADGDECADCDCDDTWCYEWDFTQTSGAAQGWQQYSATNTATWDAGQGWRGTRAGALDQNYIKMVFPSGVTPHITRIVFWVSPTLPSSGAGAYIGNVFNGTYVVNGANNSNEFGANTNVNWSTFFVGVERQGGNVTFLARITGARIEGTGENPFGSDNCVSGE